MDNLSKMIDKIIKTIGDRSYVSFDELKTSVGVTESQLIEFKTKIEEQLKLEDKKITVTISKIAPDTMGFIIE